MLLKDNWGRSARFGIIPWYPIILGMGSVDLIECLTYDENETSWGRTS